MLTKTNFGAHLSVWDRMMGTYFADEKQIARLRTKDRVASQDLISAQGISADAADFVLPQCDEKAIGGKGSGGPKTVTA